MLSEILTKELFDKIKSMIDVDDDVYVHYYVHGYLQNTYEWNTFVEKRLRRSRKQGCYGQTIFKGVTMDMVYHGKSTKKFEVWDGVDIRNTGEIVFNQYDPELGYATPHLGTLYVTVPDYFGDVFSDLLDSKTMLPEIYHGVVRVTSYTKEKTIQIV